MWLRAAAIRPVPSHAVVPLAVLDQVERTLGEDSLRAREELGLAFERFERTQPELADRVARVLSRRLDETALALGYFLSISIWIAFDKAFGKRLVEVTADVLDATEAAITLEEELRAARGDDPLDLDDVVTLEQPAVLGFIHEHVEAALDVDSALAPRNGRVNVDDVDRVYRVIVVLTLALSHAVLPPGDGGFSRELLA
ncbi:MAG: hypothetical protein WCI05_01660 [Myxococcales bacterium]